MLPTYTCIYIGIPEEPDVPMCQQSDHQINSDDLAGETLVDLLMTL